MSDSNHAVDGRMDARTVIVTGATGKIGEGIARRFAAEGASVVVTGRRSEKGESLAAELQGGPGDAVFVQADLIDPEAIASLVEATVERFGQIDVLVNNAASSRHGTYADRTIDDWEFVMDVCLRAPWLVTKHAAASMPPGGSVINVSSLLGSATDPARFPYNVAKSGLDGLTRALAVDMQDQEIRVNGIVVGEVVPEEQVGTFDQDDWWGQVNLVNRRGAPSDIAGVAAFLASEDAAYVTGTNLRADGGRLARLAMEDAPG